jgi:2-keto-3-deoxy-6-phosphogluconate aldolase
MTSLTRTSSHEVLEALRTDRALTVVRADHIPDAAQLCRALAEGGIRTVELTFTTPDVLDHLAATSPGCCSASAPSSPPTRPAPPSTPARGSS